MPESELNTEETIIPADIIESPVPPELQGLTEEQIKQVISDSLLRDLREARNILLAETDWMANSDVLMTEEWRAYRQALRDITDHYSSLEDVIWPTKPDV